MAGPGPDSGGGDIGAKLHAQGIGSGGAGGKDAQPEDIFDFLTKLLDKVGTWVTKFTGVNVESFFNTGALANLKIEQAGIQVNNQIMKQAIIPDAGGGATASIAGAVFNFKNLFANVGGLSIDPMTYNSGVDISPANLGEMPIQLANVGGPSMGGMDMGTFA